MEDNKAHLKNGLLLSIYERKIMDKFTKQQLKDWAFKTIQKDPLAFGGDTSNPAIMDAYAKEFHKNVTVEELTPKTFSILSTVSRFKNKILKEHPEFDCRVRFAPKNRRAKEA